MKLERVKSVVLFCLVLMSIFLTTQIWLNISIEGFFIMPKKEDGEINLLLSSDNDKASFVKPEKLIINNNGTHTLLFNQTEVGMIYDRIVEESKNMMSVVLKNKYKIDFKKHTFDYIEKLRLGRTVELQFPFSYDFKLLAGILGVDNPNWQDIKNVDTVLVGYDNNNLYIVDKENNSIFEFNSDLLKSSIRVMVDIINRSKTNDYIFLNEVDSEKYGSNVIIPINTANQPMPKLPKLSSESVADVDTNDKIAALFFDKDPSTLRRIEDSAGNVVYTDGEKQGVKINKSGLIEYLKYYYEASSDDNKFTLLDAVNIATNFVNNNTGFPMDTYISSIEQETINDELYKCKIGYNYRYEGVPIINNEVSLNDPIEVEIVKGEVTRYRTMVKNIELTGEDRTLKNPLEIIDILLMRLNYDKNIDIDDIMIEDMYLSYYEYAEYGSSSSISMIPVWIIETKGDFSSTGQYILNAESGVILFEPY